MLCGRFWIPDFFTEPKLCFMGGLSPMKEYCASMTIADIKEYNLLCLIALGWCAVRRLDNFAFEVACGKDKGTLK